VAGCRTGELLRRQALLREVRLDGLYGRMFDAGDPIPVTGAADQARPSRGNEDDSDEDGP
jgi:hypothetical protein